MVPAELEVAKEWQHQPMVMHSEADDDVCWICLSGPEPGNPLRHPCRCPSWTHEHCIARWQLQSAGTRRESYCDFCQQRLPDWKGILTPDGDSTSAPAVMNVNFDNKTYSFTVRPGPDGYRQFTAAIRRAFHLPDDSELNITFTCDEPSSGSLLTLSGPGAYDAAVHCAAVSAARRSSLSSDGGSAASDAPGGGGGGDRASVAERRAPAAGGAGPCPCPPPGRISDGGGSDAGPGFAAGGSGDDSDEGAGGADDAGSHPGGAAGPALGVAGGASPAARRESVSGITRRLRSVLNEMLASR